MLRSKPNNFFRDNRPSEVELIKSLDIIERLMVFDKPLALSWEKSKRGVPCLRCEGSTFKVKWSIDLYKNDFFFARVNDNYDSFDNVIKAINYVKAQLKSYSNRELTSIDTQEI